MRQVILQIDSSLDGFIARQNREIDWVKDDDVMNQDANLMLGTVDTILLGRVAYQLFVDYWPTADMDSSIIGQLAYKINHAEKIVFSKTLENVTWGKWNNARLVRGDIAEEIAAIKAQSGKNLILYAGATIAQTFMQRDLIDRYCLRVHPVVLGSGLPLFKDVKHSPNLKLENTKQYANGAVLLDYQVVRS
jgi:dihydrofolate reductase